MEIIFTGSQFERATEPLAIPDDQMVMMVDLDRCIRCGTCQLACRLEHAEQGEPGPVRNLQLGNEKSGQAQIFTLPGACRKCATPCMYYDTNNFWIRCPDEKATARAKEPACDLCMERIERGYWPSCATRCPMKTIYVGTAADIEITLKDKRFREYGDVIIREQPEATLK
ncbi:MAG: hypothetical protein JRG73_08790 [Deltaproteobacteria bacterium]|nr:hypothetical protein [Deltaproteobacteria bacterium]